MSLEAFEMLVGACLVLLGVCGLAIMLRLGLLEREVTLLQHPFLGENDEDDRFWREDK